MILLGHGHIVHVGNYVILDPPMPHIAYIMQSISQVHMVVWLPCSYAYEREHVSPNSETQRLWEAWHITYHIFRAQGKCPQTNRLNNPLIRRIWPEAKTHVIVFQQILHFHSMSDQKCKASAIGHRVDGQVGKAQPVGMQCQELQYNLASTFCFKENECSVTSF